MGFNADFFRLDHWDNFDADASPEVGELKKTKSAFFPISRESLSQVPLLNTTFSTHSRRMVPSYLLA